MEQSTEQVILEFHDASSSGVSDYLAPRPSVFDTSYSDKLVIESFLNRPIRLFEANWAVGSYYNSQFNPWEIMFDRTSIKEKLYHYNLFRADLVITAKINGTPFHYGRLMASYRPFSPKLSLNNTLHPGTDTDLPRFSQMPKIKMNPTTSEGGELRAPYFAPTPWLSLDNAANRDQIATVFVNSFNTLKHANGGTDPVSFAFFGHFENVQLSAGTSYKLQSFVKKATAAVEYLKGGVISSTATNIAAAANTLSVIPMLSPYMKATEYAASSLGSLARSIGFSRPAIIKNISLYTPRMYGNLANVDADEAVSKLTLDSQNELSVGPQVAGLSGEDQMSFNYLKRRWSYLTQFTWAKADVSDDVLFAARVSPMAMPRDNDDIRPSPLAFISMPFQYWRGSIEFRFEIVCSAYHKGKLRLLFDPCCVDTANDLFNTTMNWILDISEDSEIVVSIPYMQAAAYREIDQITTAYSQAGHYKTTGVFANGSAYANGSIAAMVLNDLTTPDSVVNNDIQINVYIRGGDDFEVMGPAEHHLSQVTVFDVQSLVTTNTPNDLNLVYGGEKITNVRTLLKRYCLHTTEFFAGSGTNKIDEHLITRPNFPYYKGGDPNGVDTAVGPVAYNFSGPTYLNYFTPAYAAWRGSIRYKSILVDADASSSGETSIAVARQSSNGASYSRATNSVGTSLNSISANRRAGTSYSHNIGLGGIAICNATAKGCLEYEIPFYSDKLFALAGDVSVGDSSSYDRTDRMWNTESVFVASSKDIGLRRYCATGEDFSLLWFINVPSMHLAGIPVAV